MFLLMQLKTLMLLCLYIISLSTAEINLMCQEVCECLKEMNHQTVMLIWPQIPLHHLNMNQVLQKFQQQMEKETGAKAHGPLKYLRNYWRSLKMPLINYIISLKLNLAKDSMMFNTTGDITFKITGSYVPITRCQLRIREN